MQKRKTQKLTRKDFFKMLDILIVNTEKPKVSYKALSLKETVRIR